MFRKTSLAVWAALACSSAWAQSGGSLFANQDAGLTSTVSLLTTVTGGPALSFSSEPSAPATVPGSSTPSPASISAISMDLAHGTVTDLTPSGATVYLSNVQSTNFGDLTLTSTASLPTVSTSPSIGSTVLSGEGSFVLATTEPNASTVLPSGTISTENLFVVSPMPQAPAGTDDFWAEKIDCNGALYINSTADGTVINCGGNLTLTNGQLITPQARLDVWGDLTIANFKFEANELTIFATGAVNIDARSTLTSSGGGSYAIHSATGTQGGVAMSGPGVSSVDNALLPALSSPLTINLATGTIPEPSTYALMALGLLGIATVARRR